MEEEAELFEGGLLELDRKKKRRAKRRSKT